MSLRVFFVYRLLTHDPRNTKQKQNVAIEPKKKTAQTLKKNIREKSFQYRTKGYGTGSAKLPAGTGAGGGSKRNLLSNGKQHMTGAGGGSAINDSSSGASRNAGRGFGNGLGYLTGNHGGGGGGGGGGIGESASLLSSSASKRRTPLKKSGPRYSSRAFVTFRSFSAATVARQVLHCARPGRMAASSAPEARDIYWPNAIVTRRQVMGAAARFSYVMSTLESVESV